MSEGVNLTMESLGDILSQMKNSELRKRTEQLTASLLNDPLVLKLRNEHPEITEKQLTLNMAKLYQCVKDDKHCSQCPGLDRCPNDFPGHYTKISVEAQGGVSTIVDRQVPCQLQAMREKEQMIKEKIRSFYVDERALSEGYSEVEIMGKDRDRSPAVYKLFQYIEQTKEQGLSPKGLYMEGSFGTGKTFLMCYMLHELAKAGYTGAIVYMPDFVEDLKSMMQDNAKLKETIELMKEVDLLIFDDIGAENLNPWVRDHILGAILNYRMNRKPTFYTSNYSLSMLEKHLAFTNKEGEDVHKGQRIMDRIAPFVDVLQIKGSNKRRS